MFCVIACVFWGIGSHAGRANEALRLIGYLSKNVGKLSLPLFLFSRKFSLSTIFCVPLFLFAFFCTAKQGKSANARVLLVHVGG